MVQYTTEILRFKQQGEKTGWSYIEVPAHIAKKIKPGCKVSFRVKGKLDNYPVKQLALLTMGGGDFIIPINDTIRKATRKRNGNTLNVQLEEDKSEFLFNAEFMACLEDEPEALAFYKTLRKGHQNYFSKWVESAKTEPTKAKRIAQAVRALSQGQHFGIMVRALKAAKNSLQ